MRRARRLLRGLQRAVPPAVGPGCTVLAYHLVGAGTASPVDLPRGLFADHLAELETIAEVLPLEQAIAAASGDSARRAPGRPLVALTFDDAFANFTETVLPMLAERSFVPTVFVPLGFLDGGISPLLGGENLAPAPWSDLAAAAARGELAVGSHGWTHTDLRRLAPDAVERELAASRRALEDRLGMAVRSFCYPRGLWSRRAERQVARHYDLAAIGGGRRWTPRQSRLRVQRVSLRRDGPRSLAPVLAAPIWLEEWLADLVRRHR